VSGEILRRAVCGACEPPLRALPADVVELLVELDAPPRLGAHLRAVHEVAAQLLDALPELAVDRAAVLFGAATHDIGKVEHPGELSGPGSAHEPAGHRLLVGRGVAEERPRFARTHADWDRDGATTEELLVSLADKVWKGKRVADLEQRVVRRLAQARGQEPWEAFLDLDDVLTHIADGAEARLAFQAAYPIRAS